MVPYRSFNLDRYNGNYCMHCNNMNETKLFFKYLDRNGRRWLSGERYNECGLKHTRYGNSTVYYFNRGTYGSILFNASYRKAIVLEYSDFVWGNNRYSKYLE